MTAARPAAARAPVTPSRHEPPAPVAFDALADPMRRSVLQLLADGGQPVGALVDALNTIKPMSQSAVSQHLKVLRDAGLVTVRADGTRRLYALDVDGIGGAAGWLTTLINHRGSFAQPLDALATEVARGRRTTNATANNTGNDSASAKVTPAATSTG